MNFIGKKEVYSGIVKLLSLPTGIFINSLSKKSLLLYFSDFNNNWGDMLNPFLLSRIVNAPVISAKRVFNFRSKDIVFGIGSILTKELDKAVVWGSGFIKDPGRIVSPPKHILALRGKLTEEIFSREGVNVPGLYGDPALLYPLYFDVKNEKKFRLGIIPHYKDLDHPLMKKIEKLDSSIKIISPLAGLEQFPNMVNSCEMILSSSLHGLILSDALGLPNRRFTLSDKIIGGNFKFNDYYSGVSVTPPHTIDLNNPMYHSTHALNDLPVKNDLRFNSALLVDTLTKYYQKQL
jgi:pyruvyltransferase